MMSFFLITEFFSIKLCGCGHVAKNIIRYSLTPPRSLLKGGVRFFLGATFNIPYIPLHSLLFSA